ncbi:hypothetical protein SteCoe_6901 [Stentor coeruleus]|uniref:B box-type domain-containing protein n=1 Tax=Stentor coeruleus TaxID=5963 RepID=A0A1R2CP02_9CILI|nr:hypothetical protein SteCoe_6901 [Stentor coeruleus]
MECEDCHINVSSLFCLGCKKHMCIKCEENKHPSTHAIVPSQSNDVCGDHKLPFDLFCETCDIMLCSYCTKIHHSSYHIIRNLLEVFRKKSSNLHAILNERGYAKKQMIEIQLEFRKNQHHDFLKQYLSLEREIYDTRQAMSKRLELHVAPTISELKEHLKEVNEDILGLKSALDLVETSSKYSFLNKYKTLMNKILTIKSKGPRPEKNVDLESVPAELQEWNERARVCKSLTSLNKAKNDILWDIWSGRLTNPDAAAAREVSQWSRLTDNYIQKISKMAQVCYFCKLPLSPDSINDECRMNTREASLYSRDSKIPPRHIGSGYHYFVKK